MKIFLRKTGIWLRHKCRVIILKRWKNRRTIYENLIKIRDQLHKYFIWAGLDPKIARSIQKTGDR